MNYISAHRTVSGWPFFCLLLTLFTTSLAAQATFCPPYPRAIDQAYVCVVAKNGFQLELEQRATLHSPVRFVFPGFALTPQLTITSLSIDFGDGLGSRTITSGSTVSVVYPTSNTQYTLTYSVNIIGDGTSNTWDGTIIYQNNANPDVNYSSEAPLALAYDTDASRFFLHECKPSLHLTDQTHILRDDEVRIVQRTEQ